MKVTMNRHLFLAISLTSLLAFSSSQALTLEFSTCNFFNYGCSKTIQNSVQENSGGFSFANFFNKWELPKWEISSFFGNAQNNENPVQVAQLGGTFSPSIINTDKTSDPNTPGSSDFGIGKTSQTDGATPKTLLTPKELFEKQAFFEGVLQKCADGSTTCIAQVTQGQKTQDSNNKLPDTMPSGSGLSGYSPNNGSFWAQNGGSETDHQDEMVYTQQQVQTMQNSYSSLKDPLSAGAVSNRDFGSGTADCSGNGIINKAANIAILDTVKFDTARLCTAFGKKITVVDAVRSCSGPSRHCFREAIDFEINGYGGREQQAMLIVSLIALGYNIGSYENNFPLHADSEKSSYWKTWSRWAHKNGQAPLPYQQQVVDALNIIGMPARSAHEFRSKYGKPSKQSMMQKAQSAIKSSGNQKLIDKILAGQALSS
jgi:hypothetical protein